MDAIFSLLVMAIMTFSAMATGVNGPSKNAFVIKNTTGVPVPGVVIEHLGSKASPIKEVFNGAGIFVKGFDQKGNVKRFQLTSKSGRGFDFQCDTIRNTCDSKIL